MNTREIEMWVEPEDIENLTRKYDQTSVLKLYVHKDAVSPKGQMVKILQPIPGEPKATPKNNHMKSLAEWLHESVQGDTLEIVKITDLENTVFGLKDKAGKEVFIVGNMHNLTFVLNGNHK